MSYVVGVRKYGLLTRTSRCCIRPSATRSETRDIQEALFAILNSALIGSQKESVDTSKDMRIGSTANRVSGYLI